MALAACSGDEEGAVPGTSPPSSGGTGGVGATGGGGSGGSGNTGGVAPFTDFPADPEIDPGLPGNIGDLFENSGGGSGPAGGGAGGSGPGGSGPGGSGPGGSGPGGAGSGGGLVLAGPCLIEPSIEAMVPRNWTPLRFEWTAPAGQNVFELRLRVDNQLNDLLVYTTSHSYSIDAPVWANLALHSAGHDIEMRIRGAKLVGGALTAGPFLGVQGPVHLAPVDAPGAVVYWTSSGGTALKGFTIGDPSVSTVLDPELVGGDTTCISCHASAPDGALTFFTRDGVGTRSVAARTVDGNGQPPTEDQVTATAQALLARHKQVAPVLSGAHYSETDAVVITVMHEATITNNRAELVWTDLHTDDSVNGWGILARTDDARQAATPTWWHDGSTIAYTSAPIVQEGVISRINDTDTTMDIYTIPYADGIGGAAMPLSGASEPNYWEFYPVISPDDTLVAFNRCEPRKEADQTWADSYDEPTAEVFVVPAAGGTAIRVEGNDPPQCTGLASPGLTNSWPRWAPSAVSHGNHKYYWLVYSSKRRDGNNPQLFISAVVTTVTGNTETIERAYPALYVTAQVAGENNHTPAWDVFQVPGPN